MPCSSYSVEIPRHHRLLHLQFSHFALLHDHGDGPVSPRVALVEDDLELRRAVAHGLRQEGYSVAEFNDAALMVRLQLAALTISGRGLADVVVSDVRMPRASGLSGVGRISRFRMTRQLACVSR